MLDRETVERLLQNNLDAKLNSELSKYGYQLDAAHKLFRFITSIFERTPPELIPRAQCFHKYGQTRLKENLFKNQNISCETLYGSAYRIFYGTILSSGSKLLMQHIPLTLK